jgi:hypothetical protein
MVETDVTVYRKISEHLLQYETDHSVVSVIDEDIHEMQIEADDLRAIIFDAGGDSYKVIKDIEYVVPSESKPNGSFYQFGPVKQYFDDRYFEIKSLFPEYEDVIEEEEEKEPVKPTYNLNVAINEIDEIIDDLPKDIQKNWDEVVQAIESSMNKRED